jgi:hypothetical protein
LQSESDKNIQAGISQILRGLYQAIRNPRSHEKYNDSKTDADSIILFIDYLTKIIGQSKSPFTKHEFLERVFESDFVPKKRYADLLVKEIPKKQTLDIFIDVYNHKEHGNGDNLKVFFNSLIEKLNDEELKEVYELISEELKTTDSTNTMRLILQIFPNNFLEKYNEISRLRLENKLIDSIRNGRFVPKKNYCQSGAFGTWAGSRYEYFILKDDLIDAILDNLSSTDEHKQDYIFRYFFHCLPKLVNPPDYRIEAVIYDGLKAGNKKFYDALKYKDKKWRKPFQEAYDNFREAEPEYDDDDIPF